MVKIPQEQISYRASGTLLGCLPTGEEVDDLPIWIILVRCTDGMFCIAKYVQHSVERLNGEYTRSYGDAVDVFIGKAGS